MKLSAITGLDGAVPLGTGDVDLSGVTADSRAVKPGMLFAALSGSKADGSRFITDAIAKGDRKSVV